MVRVSSIAKKEKIKYTDFAKKISWILRDAMIIKS